MADQSTEIAAHWRDLAPRAGLHPDAYHLDRGWGAARGRESSFVARLVSDAGAVVLKRFNPEMPEERFTRIVETMRAAEQRMDAQNRVVHVLAASRHRRCALLDWVGGDEAFQVMERSHSHEALLARLGGWFSAFHEAGGLKEGTFWPKPHIVHLKALDEDVRAGIAPVCELEAFRAAISGALIRLRDARGAPAMTSWQHGDPNLHNFIVSGTSITALDFTRVARTHLAHDIAHFLAFHGALMGGSIIAGEESDAFFNGYPHLAANDPVLRALLPLKLLRYWQKGKAGRQDMTARQLFRFERYKAALETLLSD